MKITYSRHALEKLKRADIKQFGITKKVIRKAIVSASFPHTTKYGDLAVLLPIDSYTLRVIYGKMNIE